MTGRVVGGKSHTFKNSRDALEFLARNLISQSEILERKCNFISHFAVTVTVNGNSPRNQFTVPVPPSPNAAIISPENPPFTKGFLQLFVSTRTTFSDDRCVYGTASAICPPTPFIGRKFWVAKPPHRIQKLHSTMKKKTARKHKPLKSKAQKSEACPTWVDRVMEGWSKVHEVTEPLPIDNEIQGTTNTAATMDSLSVGIVCWNVLADSYCSRRSHRNLPMAYQNHVFDRHRRQHHVRQVLTRM
jgi:hypothetical protein